VEFWSLAVELFAGIPHFNISKMPTKNRKKPDVKESHSPTDNETPTSEPAEPIKKTKKRSLGLTFAIGGIAGLFFAGFAAKNQDIQFISELRLDAFVDVIPAGILKEATEISVGSLEVAEQPEAGVGC
jgi:hypothetical protein